MGPMEVYRVDIDAIPAGDKQETKLRYPQKFIFRDRESYAQGVNLENCGKQGEVYICRDRPVSLIRRNKSLARKP